MKKIYLVKKDPKKPAGEENWNILSASEFRQFIESEGAESKRRLFTRINKCEGNDALIFIECDLHENARNKAEENYRSYRNRRDLSIGYMTVSYSSIPVDEDEFISAEDAIADESVNVEEEAIRNIEIGTMLEAIKELPEEDRILIAEMFLDEQLTEKAYAKRHGISQKGANKRKAKALLRLRKILEE